MRQWSQVSGLRSQVLFQSSQPAVLAQHSLAAPTPADSIGVWIDNDSTLHREVPP